LITTEALTKFYSGKPAVDRLSIRVEPGETYGFLGPNGSGKTTTIRMLLGLTPSTSGKIFLFGKELTSRTLDVKQRIGVVGETQHLYDEMTAQSYLELFAEMFEVDRPKRRIGELLERFGLDTRKNSRLSEFSHGMRQKVCLARALLHDPDLLILDEPVVGLDPRGVKEVRDLIQHENERGKTIFLSSHILSEVEATAHRIGIISRGKLLKESDIDTFRNDMSNPVLEIEVDRATEQLQSILENQTIISRVDRIDNLFSLTLNTTQDVRKQISEIIASQGALILGMRLQTNRLEDAFLTITEEKVEHFAGEFHST
jgi:ABC-type multidrug transport system ATPase subunit